MRAGVGVRLGEKRHEIAARPVGDERFLAVDDVVAAVAARDRANPGDVGPRRRLGHAERPDLVAPQGRLQELLDLAAGADVGDDRRRHVALHEQAHRHARRAPARILLGLGDAEPVVASPAAVLFGEVGTQDAEVARLLEQLVGEKSVFLPLVGVRPDLAFDECPDHPPELLVLFLKGLEHRTPRRPS